MFNTYFIEEPKSLLTELINTTGNYIFPEQQVHSQFEILRIMPKQTNDFIDQIPIDKATGPDGVGIQLLKLASPVISESLSRIINHCITLLFQQSGRRQVSHLSIKAKAVKVKSQTSEPYQCYLSCLRCIITCSPEGECPAVWITVWLSEVMFH